MYPRLWDASGPSYTGLPTRLVSLPWSASEGSGGG